MSKLQWERKWYESDVDDWQVAALTPFGSFIITTRGILEPLRIYLVPTVQDQFRGKGAIVSLGTEIYLDRAKVVCEEYLLTLIKDSKQTKKEEPMSFKTQKEVYEALIAGKKLQHKTWTDPGDYVHLVNGNLVTSTGKTSTHFLLSPGEWRVLKTKPKIILKNASFWDCWLAAKVHTSPWDEFKIVFDLCPDTCWWKMDSTGFAYLLNQKDNPMILEESLFDKIGYSLFHTPKE